MPKHHPQPSNNNIPVTPCASQLNLPTSLLTISCYINLVHVCRGVLVAIRCCLLFHDRESIFSAQLSDFQISGVSLQQDPNLQVLVLTQVVMRFLDRIGRPLGCPYNDKSGAGQRDEDLLEGNTISPHLLHFVLREETYFMVSGSRE
ncbi:hypothetical protein BDZ45DRAFT_312460 [Acephala macrosclerotiorum]|nr:hypothetical protein BDZ45DRAFT_312460 [Acephala macrosclerotiorum]